MPAANADPHPPTRHTTCADEESHGGRDAFPPRDRPHATGGGERRGHRTDAPRAGAGVREGAGWNGSRFQVRPFDRVSAEDSDTPDGDEARTARRDVDADGRTGWRVDGSFSHRLGAHGVGRAQAQVTAASRGGRAARPIAPSLRLASTTGGTSHAKVPPHAPRGGGIRGGRFVDLAASVLGRLATLADPRRSKPVQSPVNARQRSPSSKS